MKNINSLFSIFILTLTFISNHNLFSSENVYFKEDLGTLLSRDIFEPTELNDSGQIMGKHKYNYSDGYGSQQVCDIFIWDEIQGIRTIPSPPGTNQRFPSNVKAEKINNNGEIIGRIGLDLFTWDENNGYIFYNIPDLLGANKANMTFHDFNDQGQALVSGGYYINNDGNGWLQYSAIFQNGNIEHLNFNEELEKLGYIVSSISPLTINNKGEIAGIFDYAKRHPFLEGELIPLGIKSFFYNGQMHVIHLSPWNPRNTVKLSNNGEIFFNYTGGIGTVKAYKWSLKNGLHYLNDFIIIDNNDLGDVLGIATKTDDLGRKKSVHCLFSEDKITYFPQNGITFTEEENTAELITSIEWTDLEIELSGLDDPTLKKINNQKSILGIGQVIRSHHPFVMIPFDQ